MFWSLTGDMSIYEMASSKAPRLVRLIATFHVAMRHSFTSAYERPKRAVRRSCKGITLLSLTQRLRLQFVAPPLGGNVWFHGTGPHPAFPPKGGTTN